MNIHQKLPSDIVGLAHQVDPLSRRGFFMTATAATAAGYTLAAGPVRAQAITTDTTGLTVGEAKVEGGRRRDAGLLRAAGERRTTRR